MQPVLPGDSSDKIHRFEPSTLYYDRSLSFSHTEGQMNLVIALHMDVDRRAPPEHSAAFWGRAPPHTCRCGRGNVTTFPIRAKTPGSCTR